MYLPAIVIVGYYFDKRRALATGISLCGSGIGAFVFAPMSEYFISEFGWKGATLIIAGISLNGVVAGAVFRPLIENKRNNPIQKKKDLTQSDSNRIKNERVDEPHKKAVTVDAVKRRTLSFWQFLLIYFRLLLDPLMTIYAIACFLVMIGKCIL